MKLICVFLLSVFPLMSLAAERPVVNAQLQQQAMTIVERLIETSFPELKGLKITPKGIKNPQVFLATDIEISSLFGDEREYVLYLNNQLIEKDIPSLALQGILAHELAHFSDYEKMNTFELAVFYAQILMGGEFEANYERRTDLQAFERGFAIGIKVFRHWLYEQISPEARALKETNYYTPAQIDNWMLDQKDVTLL